MTRRGFLVSLAVAAVGAVLAPAQVLAGKKTARQAWKWDVVDGPTHDCINTYYFGRGDGVIARAAKV